MHHITKTKHVINYKGFGIGSVVFISSFHLDFQFKSIAFLIYKLN
jgi:hypothetical protein